MPNSSDRQIIKSVDVAGQRVNLWRPMPLIDLFPRILSKTTPAVLLPYFDQMEFVLPDPSQFRTTDIFSNDDLRGFRLKNRKYEPIVGPDADFVLYQGRVQNTQDEKGMVLERDSRFLILQTFFDLGVFETERRKYQKLVDEEERESKKN